MADRKVNYASTMNSTILAFFLGLAVLQVSCVFDSPKGFPVPQGQPLSKTRTADPLQLDTEDEDEDEDSQNKTTRPTIRPALLPNIISVLGVALGASPERVNKSVENFIVGYNHGKNPTTESLPVRRTLPDDEDEDEDEDGEEQDLALDVLD